MGGFPGGSQGRLGALRPPPILSRKVQPVMGPARGRRGRRGPFLRLPAGTALGNRNKLGSADGAGRSRRIFFERRLTAALADPAGFIVVVGSGVGGRDGSRKAKPRETLADTGHGCGRGAHCRRRLCRCYGVLLVMSPEPRGTIR